MLIPIIKDFNNTFSYLISNSIEKTKEVFDPASKSLLHLSEGQYDQSRAFNDIFKIGWTSIRIIFLFLVQTIQYIVSFQWLRDFAYLPVSIPNNMLHSHENNTFIQNFNNSIVSLVDDRQSVLQRFLFSGARLTSEMVNNQTIAKPETGVTISDQNLPYHNFILGLPNVTHSGAPINSWSLSFLSNKWFDPLTVPVNFLSTGLESGSKNISQLSSLPEQITGDPRISNIILMSILICIATGFSSFFNSFFISFPLSLSNLLSLRYLIIQKFWAGCLSVLGIVFGEAVFMLFLVLPPPFIQITLVYLESVWPYIIGLSLIIFIIFDLVSNPYTNNMSLYQSNNQISSAPNISPLVGTQRSSRDLTKQGDNSLIQFLRVLLKSNGVKIFGFSFLLALTEQSCYFSFFGSLNLSSTGNFLDTYLFAASRSPIILFFSCAGFLIGSFLAIIIYNLIIAKAIFLVASFGIKIKQYNPNSIRNWVLNRQTNFGVSIDPSNNSKNIWIFIFQIYTTIKNNIISRLRSLFFSLKSKDFFKSLLLELKNLIQLFIRYLPGGKRIIFFLFPGQAHSYKSDFQATKASGALTPNNQSFKTEPKSAFFSIETRIENMLRSDWEPSPAIVSQSSKNFKSVGPSTSIPALNDLKQERGRAFDPSSAYTGGSRVPRNTSQLGGSAFYNKIDKVLLTCLITLSFTTIPYYSFDYLINSFFGFIPQEQILNAQSLRVNFPDYTNLLGITLSDNNSVINTDVSLYDRAHFMYGEWPNSFESLNYQGELMWTNLRDHRRQKRTRRSTRLKFKTLKTKISTSWKEFKRSSGFSGSTRDSAFDSETKWDPNLENNSQAKLNQDYLNASNNNVNFSKTSHQQNNSQATAQHFAVGPQKYLRNTNYLSNLFYKIFLAEPNSPHTIKKNQNNSANSQREYLSKTFDQSAVSKNEITPKIPEEIRRSTSLNETIKPLSTSTFIDLSGGEKYIKTYPKNWKRVITEKYYQNPIYQTILANDLKNFLKREPLTQQLTNNQENELYFLRVKMAHYYDSLRFYFTLKESINSTRSKSDGALKTQSESGDSQTNTLALNGLKGRVFDPPPTYTDPNVEESLKGPPFQFKSMTSMNYRQQFKGTLKTVKQLFAISLPQSISGFSNAQYEQDSANNFGITSKKVNQPINAFLEPTKRTEPVEKSYKYDKYLFNEYAYPKNEFLHEEGRGFGNRKSNISPHSPNSTVSATGRKGNMSLNESTGSRGSRGISLATKNIYNMFGSNDPFYVGWDQNLRKFVLTSRILSRSSALNYNTINSKLDVNENKKQKKNVNKEELDTSSAIPIYSSSACRSTSCEAMEGNPTKDIKKLEEKKPNFKQQSAHIYRPYTCWPFFKHQLKNLPNRPYFVLYENYLNILNKRIHLFSNININDIDTKSLTFLYSYSFNNNVKKYVSQLPINIYKQSMRPTTLENLFTPISNARSSLLWPGSTMPAWEYYFW